MWWKRETEWEEANYSMRAVRFKGKNKKHLWYSLTSPVCFTTGRRELREGEGWRAGETRILDQYPRIFTHLCVPSYIATI